MALHLLTEGYTIVTGNHTCGQNDFLILNHGSSTITITLPTVAESGSRITFYFGINATGAVFLTMSGHKLNKTTYGTGIVYFQNSPPIIEMEYVDSTIGWIMHKRCYKLIT